MKLIDFLFYYLSLWFQKREIKFKKMDYLERVPYVLGITSILWVMFIVRTVEFLIYKKFKSIIPNYIFVIIALLLMFLFKHIYITKGRYRKVLGINEHGFNISEKAGIRISIIFVFLSLLIPMAIAVLLHKMNGAV